MPLGYRCSSTSPQQENHDCPFLYRFTYAGYSVYMESYNMIFCDWFLSLSIMLPGIIHVEHVSVLFFFFFSSTGDQTWGLAHGWGGKRSIELHPPSPLLPYFLLLNNFSLYRYYCIHQLMDIWNVSDFWLIWIMLLWTYLYKFLCGHAFLQEIYIGVELLGCNCNCVKLLEELPGCWTILCSHLQCMRVLISPYSHQHLLWCLFILVS